jgi:hypothetical protein
MTETKPNAEQAAALGYLDAVGQQVEFIDGKRVEFVGGLPLPVEFEALDESMKSTTIVMTGADKLSDETIEALEETAKALLKDVEARRKKLAQDLYEKRRKEALHALQNANAEQAAERADTQSNAEKLRQRFSEQKQTAEIGTAMPLVPIGIGHIPSSSVAPPPSPPELQMASQVFGTEAVKAVQNKVETPKVSQEELARRYFNSGFLELGACMTTLGNVMQQGDRTSNNGTLGGVAIGLERAAAYFRGESFKPLEPLQKRLLEHGPKLIDAIETILAMPEAKSGHGAQTFDRLRHISLEITERKTGS